MPDTKGVPRISYHDTASLLAEIVQLRNEARSAEQEMIPALDPTGDARTAYGVIADRLDEIIANAIRSDIAVDNNGSC
jgi:tRNA(Glu) U13 pseudouridine synthase TruD